MTGATFPAKPPHRVFPALFQLTCQDKAPSVVQRALEKHSVSQSCASDYQLFQVLPGDRELLIPDSANVFYAMSPAAPGDFLLRRKEGKRHTASASPT